MEQVQIGQNNDTIAAISTPPGVGGIAVIRVSGPDARNIVSKAWKGADLLSAGSHTSHLGKYFDVKGELIDFALANIFIAPSSFTGEDTVELNVHGSSWIQKTVLHDLIKRGARIANPGEFTQRAFLNGKLDLAQAEGVADLIAASSKAAHDLAVNQTNGSFSKEFNSLREQLVEFASLLELELDFSEEDVEFADRNKLIELCNTVLDKINSLADSFHRGEVMKNGVPVVIAGIPNAGKSSLLNLLLHQEKAIVTDIPGTTRDIIEDTVEIDGILFRFIDTAGLRDTDDTVEGLGVERAKNALGKAYIVIWVIDPTQDMETQYNSLSSFKSAYPSKPVIVLFNKSDLKKFKSSLDFNKKHNSSDDIDNSQLIEKLQINPENSTAESLTINFSTTTREGLDKLTSNLISLVKSDTNPQQDVIVTNARHYEALTQASHSLTQALEALKSGISPDFIAQDIREAIHHLSLITGDITTDTLLHSIFSRFCIGK